jgi:hypothetical protein
MSFQHTPDQPFEPTDQMLERAMKMLELHPKQMWMLTMLDLVERLSQTDEALRRAHREISQEMLNRGISL